ncbi:unnamed protein product [Symbiodinium sp. CCMP2456]|nr:unnamed protein product [Symbiodinium sp. CCMP2456]
MSLAVVDEGEADGNRPHPHGLDTCRTARPLRIVGLTGLLGTISIDLQTTVTEAQKMIAKSLNIPVPEQHLISQSRCLSCNELLGGALGENLEVTLLRCDRKTLILESAKQTGSVALERARRMVKLSGSIS